MTLKEWRKSEGLTVAGAAARCGISVRTWEGWEYGPHQPNLAAAAKIVEASRGKVTLADLMKKGAVGR